MIQCLYCGCAACLELTGTPSHRQASPPFVQIWASSLLHMPASCGRWQNQGCRICGRHGLKWWLLILEERSSVSRDSYGRMPFVVHLTWEVTQGRGAPVVHASYALEKCLTSDGPLFPSQGCREDCPPTGAEKVAVQSPRPTRA